MIKETYYCKYHNHPIKGNKILYCTSVRTLSNMRCNVKKKGDLVCKHLVKRLEMPFNQKTKFDVESKRVKRLKLKVEGLEKYIKGLETAVKRRDKIIERLKKEKES